MGGAVEVRPIAGRRCSAGKNERNKTMKQFLLLYHGPATPPGASHKGWPGWFKDSF